MESESSGKRIVGFLNKIITFLSRGINNRMLILHMNDTKFLIGVEMITFLITLTAMLTVFTVDTYQKRHSASQQNPA
jgi:hypothetical protein